MTAPTSLAVIGAGVTGLAAGSTTGAPVFEAADGPGGICASYYVRPGEQGWSRRPPEGGEAYRFEIGGGHWIFGADDAVMELLQRFGPVLRSQRRAAVHVRADGVDALAPYPIQYNLFALGPELAGRALAELRQASDRAVPAMAAAAATAPAPAPATMQDWMDGAFGPTLCRLFFTPFHERYTAGLTARIAPQDAGKTPFDASQAERGVTTPSEPTGYNTSFAYPAHGLDAVVRSLAGACDVRYGARVERFDVERRRLVLAGGDTVPYGEVLSTVPLCDAVAMAGLDVAAPADPATSVLVVNIGARRGPNLPDLHWVYEPQAASGFHRYGVYSNVDESFLPASARRARDALRAVRRARLPAWRPSRRRRDGPHHGLRGGRAAVRRDHR